MAAFQRSRSKQKSEKTSRHGFDDHDLSQEEVAYRVGARVLHELLGEGVIEEIEGHGELLRLTVRFGESGRKRILARYARLELLDAENGL